MRVLILSVLLVSALAAPQLKPENQQSQVFQSQAPLQLILLPAGSSQSSFSSNSVQGQQAIPAGAQIVYLQTSGLSNGGQGQVSYIQGAAPQGQVAYIQGGVPQGQIAYIQGGAPPQGQVAYIQGVQGVQSGVQSSQFSYSQNAAPAPPSQQFNVQSVQSQQQYNTPSATPPKSSFSSKPSSAGSFSSFNKQSSFTQTKTQSKPAAKPAAYKPAPASAPGKSSYKGSGSPAPGTPGTPGEGGVFGYVTIKQSQDDNFDGNFQYDFETDHGIVVNAVGTLKNPGSEEEIQVISGSYSYKTPDGTVITTTYTADENGFIAQGDHLPVPPPLPEAIAKSIEYARSLPPSEDDQ